MKKILILAGVLALGACAGLDLQTVQNDIATGIQKACVDVNAVAALNPGSPVGAYATGACGTATAVAALVQNSGTIQWLGTLQAQLAAPAAPAKS